MSIPSTAAPLSAQERHQVKNFVRLVEEMLQSDFYESTTTMDHSVSGSVSADGQFQLAAPEYDWNDLRSFLLSFRQIALNERDPVYITRIRNVVSQHTDPSFRDDLSFMKKYVTAVLSGKRIMASLGVTTDTGMVQLTGVTLLEALVNGELFHSGAEYDHILEQLRDVPRGSYLMLVFMDVIMPVLHAAWHLVKVIVKSNLLLRGDLPDRLRASWEKWLKEHPADSPGGEAPAAASPTGA